MDNTASGTAQKALKLNLDARAYGTFAEIGAGQEVARWFFSVGGAAGTVAKTGSAYDMAVSDALYGPTQRYVSRQRLEAMLEHELRFIRTLKESLRLLTMVPLRRRPFQLAVQCAIGWYDDISHYTSLLCAGKIEGSLSGRRFRAPGPGAFDSPREVVSWRGFQSRAVQDPGPVSQRVVRSNFSSLYGKSQGGRADVQLSGRRLQSHPALCLGMFGAVVGNSLVCAQRGYALLGPTVAAPRS